MSQNTTAMTRGGVQALSAAPARRVGTIALIGNGSTTLTAAIASVLAAPQQEAQEPYPIDADPQGIRAVVADAITGALAFGAQGASPPPEGHWLTPFWEMAREEAMRNQPASVSSDTLYLLRRLLSNQHTMTSSEFSAELEKIVGEAPQPAPAPLSEQDPLQGAANWLATAHPALETSTLAGKLSIGYNRAKRLHDAALAAQGGK